MSEIHQVYQRTNWSFGTLASTITSGSNILTVDTGSSLPVTAPPFILTIWDSKNYPNPTNDPNAEIMIAVYASANTYTITRAQEGTSAVAHNAGARCGMLMTAGLSQADLFIVGSQVVDETNIAPGKVLEYNGTGLGYSIGGGSGGGIVSGTFTNSNLSSGILTITHNLSLSAPYTINVIITDNNGNVLLPGSIVCSTNSVAVNLSSFGTLTGTWGYAYGLISGFAQSASQQNVVTGSRAISNGSNHVYQNTTGSIMFIVANIQGAAAQNSYILTDSHNPPTTNVCQTYNPIGPTVVAPVVGMILPGNYYQITTDSGTGTIITWTEWIVPTGGTTGTVTQNFTGVTSVNVPLISGHIYKVVVDYFQNTTAGTPVIQFNSDNTTGHYQYAQSAWETTIEGQNNPSTSFILPSYGNVQVGGKYTADMTISTIHQGNFYGMVTGTATFLRDTNNPVVANIGGYYVVASEISSMQWFTTAGTMSGTITVTQVS